jgi:predicted secreted protein with PEFG-CTERM motif
MKTKAISSIFVLFAIAAGMASMAPTAFADHSEVTIVAADNSGVPTDCNAGWPDATTSDCYTPSTATVDVGGTVTMLNDDASGMMHTFTSGTGFADELSAVTFDSGNLMADMSYTWIPEVAGEVPYYCQLHPWMIGVIIVQEAAAAGHDDDHAAEEAAEAAAELAAAEAAAELAAAEAAAELAAAEAAAELAAAEAAAELAAAEAAEDVELMVMISDSQVMGGTQIELEFNILHVNYELTATQNGEVVFETQQFHSMDLIATHQIDALGSDENPIDVEVVSLGIGAPGEEDSWTGEVGEVTTAKVVPEFGTIAMMVLAVAIISIVAVTAKSRVVPRF